MIEINGINHVAISVADLEESIAWYQRVFGFTVIDRSEIPGTGVKVSHMQGKGFLLEIFCAENSNPLPKDRRIPNLDFLTQGNNISLLASKTDIKPKKRWKPWALILPLLPKWMVLMVYLSEITQAT